MKPEAELVDNQFIKIAKGIVFYWKNNKQFYPHNKKTYWLHLPTQEW